MTRPARIDTSLGYFDCTGIYLIIFESSDDRDNCHLLFMQVVLFTSTKIICIFMQELEIQLNFFQKFYVLKFVLGDLTVLPKRMSEF